VNTGGVSDKEEWDDCRNFKLYDIRKELW
jgi:hypothetical protein